ncbi:sulfite exporter TauE/SafE family protein [Porticoccus sp. W117]|uniref:sulfite exporter TauE/SafE family protein n=1 Tax=Porticoccus sp. W117 TaxID=3054777 RepID=UPI00259A21D7|nr:sulfite exporter TauE/SafE family protein [Porticoccus sp. W117]MDM3870695.1 sulfite exporter TauE/SafE family protein [Porticoccus sp. W117]
MEALVGSVVGLVLGLTGAGGAIFAVPLFMLLLNYSPSYAAGISLGVVGFSALIGVLGRLRHKVICWRSAGVMVVGGALFAPVGRWLAAQLNERLITVSFSLLALYVAINMVKKARATKQQQALEQDAEQPSDAQRQSPGRFWLLPLCGAATGLLSGIFGVGGGFLIVPVLTLVVGLDIKRSIATSLLVISVISAAGFLSHLWLQPAQDWHGLLPLAIGAVAGMAVGTFLVRRISSGNLQEIFAACVVGLVSVTLVREFI